MPSSSGSSEVRSRWPFRSIPLRVALLLPLVLSVAGGVGGVAYLSWQGGRHLALRLTEQLRREVTDRTEEHLARYLQIPLQINALNQGAVRGGLLPDLTTPSPADLEVLEAHFARQLQPFPELSYVGFVSAQGGFVIARRHADGSIWTYHTPGLLPGSVQGCQRDPETGDPTGLRRQLGFVDLRQLFWFPQLLQSEGIRDTWVVTRFFAELPAQDPERLIMTSLSLTDSGGAGLRQLSGFPLRPAASSLPGAARRPFFCRGEFSAGRGRTGGSQHGGACSPSAAGGCARAGGLLGDGLFSEFAAPRGWRDPLLGGGGVRSE
jgi:hypothetical protein